MITLVLGEFPDLLAYGLKSLLKEDDRLEILLADDLGRRRRRRRGRFGQIAAQRDKLAARRGRVGGSGALLELVRGQPPFPGRVPQRVGGALPLGVRRAKVHPVQRIERNLGGEGCGDLGVRKG